MTRRNFAILLVLGATATAAVAVGGYWTWRQSPPPMPTTAQEALETLASPRFQRMPDYRQAEYTEQARRLVTEMPAADRQSLFDRVGADEATREALDRAWQNAVWQRGLEFARADTQQRIVLLDELINQQEARRLLRQQGGGAQRAPERPAPDARQRRDERGRVRGMIQERMEKGNPQQVALFGEFYRALAERRRERGL